MQNFKTIQREFSRHVRDPAQKLPQTFNHPRIHVYQRGLFAGIEEILSSTFITVKKVLTRKQWNDLIQLFLANNTSTNPYFHVIPECFVEFLRQQDLSAYPSFTFELAHYDWAELAVDIANDEVQYKQINDSLNTPLATSPVSALLIYHFPVHKITPSFQPTASETKTYLVVYRDQQLNTHYLEIDAFTAHLYELFQATPCTGNDAISQALNNTQTSTAEHHTSALTIVQKLINNDILVASN